ncbi:cyclin-D1-1-like isoform X2 [Diospyros lotus]|uniref:cyclin-D1-1-like isoform X2 n=1 Tax=Diospyros lotus TaxID=55363 RepID=UPI00225A99DF|nr:cyclin-D1-1-like isoform X2 [Diospyros lotus]
MSISPDHSAASLHCPDDSGSDPHPFPFVLHSPPPDDSVIAFLVESELHHVARPDYLSRCSHRQIDLTARQDSINWILKVHAHYEFRPVTAYLSVNYFDRVLSSHSFPGNGWPLQLLSVACLSLAAKMEEPYVPLLLDLQVFEPRFMFEPRTVQRMELWIMASLDWRLRSVTPFDFLDYFASKLPSSCSNSDALHCVLSASSDLVLNTIRVIDFLGFRPSTIAAAAVLSAAGETVDAPEEAFYERANKEMVRSCHQRMEEYLVDTCPSADHKDLAGAADPPGPPPPPPSPVGVLDAAAAACGSCDTRSEIPVSGTASGWGSSAPEPQNKRARSSVSDVQEQQQQGP